jgi:uncharacterized membrane protein YhhN
MITIVLSILALSSGLLHIRAEYYGPRRQIYIFKPLTTSLILLIVLLASDTPSERYKMAVVAGLAFSLAGDIFLMLPGDRFRAGLASFLVAHLFYIVAFTSEAGFNLNVWILSPYLLFGLLMMFILWPYLGRMKVPATLYMVAIVVMAWQATGRWSTIGGTSATLSLAGALFFVVSDSVLALNRFRKPFPSAQLLILSTYYVAQWFIALSVVTG